MHGITQRVHPHADGVRALRSRPGRLLPGDREPSTGVVPTAEDIEAGFGGSVYTIATDGAGARTAEASLVGDVMAYTP